MKKENVEYMLLQDSWSDFGMKYRGIWNQTNIYNENDVVWVPVDHEKKTANYFVCREEHIAEAFPEEGELWRFWGKLNKQNCQR